MRTRPGPVPRLAIVVSTALAFGLAAAPAAHAAQRMTLRKDEANASRLAALRATILEDYGSFVLVELPEQQSGSGVSPTDGLGTLRLRDAAFDPLVGPVTPLPPRPGLHIEDYEAGTLGLYIVQFHGPIRRAWRDALGAAGARVIEYLPDCAYVVEMTPAVRDIVRSGAAVRAGRWGRSPVQWVGIYQPAYKISPALLDRSGEVAVTLLALETPAGQRTLERILESGRVLQEPLSRTPYLQARALIDAGQLEAIARERTIYRIDEWLPPAPCDEVGALNVAGQRANGSVGGFGRAGTPYLAWLSARGFDVTNTWEFAVNVADTGVDKGLREGAWHRDLYNPAGTLPRIVLVKDWTGDAGTVNEGVDGSGHGTSCAGILAGYDDAAGRATAAVSSAGYHFGLGVAPNVRLVSSKIFTALGAWDLRGTSTQLESAAYAAGARVSSNSWSAAVNAYTIDAREYDGLVRDASPDPGNQAMTIVFAAGNGGPAPHTVGSPGIAKNVITVAAAENWWPEYTSCGWSSANQDTPGDDIVAYSGRGPAADGRIKPDLAAIANGWITLRGQYAGTGCGAPYDTADVNLYRNFNGTSAATPATAGAAALVYQARIDRVGTPPSPALVKAILVATARDLAGGVDAQQADGTGPELGHAPSESQGWGLVDTGRALDSAAAIVEDQGLVFAATGELYERAGAIADSAKPVRIVLAWTDAPGNTSAAPWKNDLDLEVELNGTLYRGNVLSAGISVPGGSADVRNNVEVVSFPAGTAGGLRIRVRAANIADDGVPGNDDPVDQDFALYAYNATACAPERAGALPEFAGVAEVSALAAATCRLDLAWVAATPRCGAGVTYDVYRSTSPGFTPGSANRIARGVGGTGFPDTLGLRSGVVYFYIVRAVDASSGIGEGNAVERSGTPAGPGGTRCAPGSTLTPGEVSPSGSTRVQHGTGTVITLTYAPAVNATDTTVYVGTTAAPVAGLSWTRAICALGISGSATFDPGSPAPGRMFYFVPVGNNGLYEGSYGRASSGAERVPATGLECSFTHVTDISAPFAPASHRDAPRFASFVSASRNPCP